MIHKSIAFPILLVGCFVFFWCALAGATDLPQLTPNVRNALVRAQKALSKGKVKEVEQDLSPLLKDNAHPLVCFILGNAYFLDHNLDRAYKVYDTGLKNAPDYLPLVENFASVCFELKKFDTAAVYFLRAWHLSRLKGHVNNQFLYNAAVSYYQNGQYNSCFKVLKELFDISSSIPKKSYCSLLLICAMKVRHVDTAVSYFKRFTYRYPAVSFLWLFLSKAYIIQKDYKDAAICLETSYRLRKKGATPKKWEELANIYAYTGAFLKAASCIKYGYSGHYSPRILDKIISYYIQAHNYKEAVSWLKRAIKVQPAAKRYFLLGKLYYEHSDFNKAICAFQKGIAISKAQYKRLGNIWMLLGVCAFETNRINLARKAFLNAEHYHQFYGVAKSYIDFISLLKD